MQDETLVAPHNTLKQQKKFLISQQRVKWSKSTKIQGPNRDIRYRHVQKFASKPVRSVKLMLMANLKGI